MMRTPGHSKVKPFRSLLAALSVVLFSMASSTSAWSIHSSLSNATALYFEENRVFRVYLIPEEILDYILLPQFNCSVVDKQAYIRTITQLNGTRGTLLQWNNEAPPEKNDFNLTMNCDRLPSSDGGDTALPVSTPQTSTSPPSKRRKPPAKRDIPESGPTEPPKETDLIEKPEPAVESTTLTANAPTEATLATPASGELASANPTSNSTLTSSTELPRIESTTTPVAGAAAEVTSPSSMPTTPESITKVAPTTTSTTQAPSKETTLLMESTTTSEVSAESIGNLSVAVRQPSDDKELTKSTSTSDPSNSEQGFSLVITRVSMDFVHGQELSSLDDVFNISRELEAAMSDKKITAGAVLRDLSVSTERAEKLPCFVLPKEVRVVEAQYVLFSVSLNSTSGELIRGGRMLRSCGYENWRPGKDFLAEAAHVRFLDAKLFQLQVLSICLAAAVIVFALSAVFLCTKWRLAVRGSRREANHEFYIKTFHTKEHQYAANDDFYGFPTIRRDSTFYRSPNNTNATPKSIGGSSFVNGAFQDGEDHQNLPAPPPELRTCIINDANFTDIPLHNLGSDSLRAHRGAHRHQSPPPPPLRTVSSGYMSGQSTPAVEYHNPHDVMILPPIPKEDYSDSDSESGNVSLKADDSPGRAVERKGRFTVRTAL